MYASVEKACLCEIGETYLLGFLAVEHGADFFFHQQDSLSIVWRQLVLLNQVLRSLQVLLYPATIDSQAELPTAQGAFAT
jgi:hypothetical protein